MNRKTSITYIYMTDQRAGKEEQLRRTDTASRIFSEMGWLLGCFGYSKKRKRFKPSHKIGNRNNKHGSYQTLQSSSISEGFVDKTKQSDTTNHDLRKGEVIKENTTVRIRKKVRFDLNVTVYEPLKSDQEFETSGEDNPRNLDDQEEESEDVPLCWRDANRSKKRPYPCSSYRYCSYNDNDEEDGVFLNSEILSTDDDDDKDGNSDGDHDDDYREGIVDPRKIYSEEITDQIAEICSMPLRCSMDEDGEMTNDSAVLKAWYGRQYINSVLRPIENQSQWKKIKVQKW